MLMAQLDDQMLSRFWAKVRKADGDGCWEWIGSGRSTGYGGFGVRGVVMYAHRLSWEIANGPLPRGEGFHGTVVCHRCDNSLCVRPDHLFIGTQGDNMRDRDRKGRTAKGPRSSRVPPKKRVSPLSQLLGPRQEGKCRYGHDMTDASNVRMMKKNGREYPAFRKCSRRYAQEYIQRVAEKIAARMVAEQQQQR